MRDGSGAGGGGVEDRLMGLVFQRALVIHSINTVAGLIPNERPPSLQAQTCDSKLSNRRAAPKDAILDTSRQLRIEHHSVLGGEKSRLSDI